MNNIKVKHLALVDLMLNLKIPSGLVGTQNASCIAKSVSKRATVPKIASEDSTENCLKLPLKIRPKNCLKLLLKIRPKTANEAG